MPRTAEGRVPVQAELLDRTGIVAASLPQRRRSVEVVAMPAYRSPVCDQDLRPKTVVIRRRARAWLGGGAALALIGLGWLGGGLLNTAPASDDATPLDPRPAVAAAPAAPVAAPKVITQPAPPPVTVYVPVPVRVAVPKYVPAPGKQPAQVVTKTVSADQLRDDLAQQTSPKPSATPDPVEAFVAPFMSAAEQMQQQPTHR